MTESSESRDRRPYLLDLEDVSKDFFTFGGIGKTRVSAVHQVTLAVKQGATVGVVGESGCGKSTLARLVVGLLSPNDGTIIFDGLRLGKRRPRKVTRDMQMVFQDPHSALNPRATVGEAIGFPLRVQGVSRREVAGRVDEMIDRVGLHRNYESYYPHQLSGGQRQRVNIARALALRPKLVVLDESVSALDKSIQAQILDLLKELQTDFGLTYMFISHDLNVVEYMSDEVAVMYLGQVVEHCSAATLYKDPLHPYTQVLLSSIPKIDPRERTGERPGVIGELPSAIDPPSGCRFRTRCPFAMDQCAAEAPRPIQVEQDHSVACHLYREGSTTPVTLGATSLSGV